MVFECTRKDWFCFVCGHYVLNRNKRNFTDDFEKAYRLYFDIDVGAMKGKPWMPAKVCARCHHLLIGWLNSSKCISKRNPLKYTKPMIWNIQEKHDPRNCYFCVNETFGFSTKTMHSIVYKVVPSVEQAQIRQPNESFSAPLDSEDMADSSTFKGTEYVPN